MLQARKHPGIWNKDSTSVKPLIQLEQLEPRILLSANSSLNITPDPLQDTLLNNTQQEIQYAELLDTNEQAEEQISLEARPVDPDIEAYEPIFTLLVDDENANDESADVDLSLDVIDYAQVKNDIVLLLNDSSGDIESLGITEGYVPLSHNDDNISIEENTSVEIRGPPLTLSEMAFQGSDLSGDLLLVQDDTIVLSDGQILFLGSGPTPSELNLSMPTNINAADTLNTDQLWSGGGLGLDLTGSGLIVGIWEAGDGSGAYYVRSTHQELAGRVVFGDTSGTPVFSDHATHVAGTIAASGVNAAAHGMASEIDIRSYSVDNFIQEMYQDASLIVASNHSYSEVVGWSIVNVSGVGVTDIWVGDRSISSTESAAFGKYDAFTNDLDDVLIDNPYLLSVWSAGNDRNDHFTNYRGNNTYVTYLSSNPGIGGWSGSGWYLVPNSGVTSAPGSDGNGGTGYDSLPPDQVAKNSLVVGAINDITADPYNLTDVIMTTFSSWGPTDDGRIKPDVVANGMSLFSSGAVANDDYFQASGTSMAAPNVTGTAALLIQYYENLFGYRPLSATTKGLLIHTAFDAGNIGPDFTYGWGVVDAAAAATFLGNTKFPTPSTMISEDTYTGFEKKYYFENTGTDPLKSTLIWTDPEGNPQGSGIDDNTSVLVHDLDLWITDPDGITYYPWTLNASLPGDPAVRTDPNHVDNVEQVLVDTPKNGTYTIHVGASGNAFTQDFSLLVDALCYAPQPVVYSQDFESGMPQAGNGWWYYWDNDGYIKVENGHLIMAKANPNMEILGNSQIIADGDTTPSVSDDTYFGGTQQGNSIVRTFTIRNSGSEVLNLTGSPDKVIITGSTDFIVTQQPTSPVAANGGTTTFEITFTPSSYGTKTATISIANNDDYKNPFDFVVQGYVSLFGSQQVISTQADAANSVYACDLDGDGDSDILSASTIDDKIAWYENLGGGAFGSQQVISTQARFANSVYACDLDGDGDNDVLSASTFDDKVAWYENLGGGIFGPQQILDDWLDYAPSVYASDLDGDGDNDVLSVSTYNDTIAWYENLGGGTFSSRQVVSTQSDGPTSVYACDMDGDGDNDVLAASRTLQVNDKIAWYENQGGGSFGSEHVISTQVDDPYHVYAGDLDGDGDNDVISTSYNDDKIAWYENLGGGTFSGQQVISTQANGAWSSYVCDLDGDGDNDVLSASSDDDTVAWYENQGGGAFGSQRVISTQADRVRSVFACDLDGDGDNDVLSASVTDDKVAWYENLGMGATPTYTNNQIFLSDDFSDGNYDGWTLVDQGTLAGPMAWSAASGVMVQSSNVHSTISIDPIAKLGTYAYWQTGIGWTDYTATVTIKSTDNDAIGIMFRYQDENNYYRFIWDKERNSRQVVKCEDGVFSVLAEDFVPYVTGKNYQVKIAVQGSLLQVSIDGSPVFSVNDSTFSSGSIALYSWGNSSSYFDDILVEGLSGGNQAPVISSVTATPTTISDTQTSQLQVTATDPDSGPNPSLTYNWTVPSGQGILDSYNIENPTYTPPDVSSTQIFTLMVEVSDGAAVTSETVDITVTDAGGGPQILLSDDFADGNYDGWTLVDQ
ncbi:MAG: FG-GAP-like repeat-containing protein, partial [Sedimentisphaerales bacterium]|nr:FG-GAP-like repeat-containing protein [Sedimentisphaerales bacterium]